MAALKAYADESGKEEDPETPVISMAAFVGTTDQWREFDRKWKRALRETHAPYLHMKELDKGRGAFSEWTKGKRDKLVRDTVSALIQSPIRGVGCSFIKDDLVRALREHDLPVNLYAFSLYITACSLSWMLDNEPFELILDRIDKGNAKAAAAEEYFRSDHFARGCQWPTITPLVPDGAEGSQNIYGLQAADLGAWEARKSVQLKLDWFENVKPGLTRAEFDASGLAFQAEKNPQKGPVTKENHFEIFDRVSMGRLARARKLDVSRWDYERLNLLMAQRKLLRLDER